MPAVEQADPEVILTDWLYDLVADGDLPDLIGWTVGTVGTPGETPANAIRVRMIGGVEEQRVADRPILDLRLWGDGTYLHEDTVKTVARQVIARLRRDFRAVIVADPIPLPDPENPDRTHVLATVQLLTRGTQR